MVIGNSTHWDAVEQWSPTLFLAGGWLLAGHATVSAIGTFTAWTPPPDAFVTTGHLVALVGLLGLYPALADQTPKLARAAGAISVIPLVGWVAMTGVQLLTIGGLASSLTDVLPGPIIMLVVGSTIITYALFGVGTLRVGQSRTTSLLVFVPGGLISVLLVGSVFTGEPALVGVLIGAGLALSMLALGYRLRAWDRSKDRVQSGDVIAG